MYLTRIVPRLQFCPSTIPSALNRHYANVALRTGVHLSTLLPFRIGLIFFSLATLEHMSVRRGFENLSDNYMDGLKAAYCYWPLVLIGLYTVVPLRYGNLYFDTLNLVWAVALSYFANRRREPVKQSTAPAAIESKRSIKHRVKKIVASKTAPSSPRRGGVSGMPSTITLHSQFSEAMPKATSTD